MRITKTCKSIDLHSYTLNIYKIVFGIVKKAMVFANIYTENQYQQQKQQQ